MPLQNWLNAWVKVNNKHVVFPNDRHDRRSGHGDRRSSQAERRSNQNQVDRRSHHSDASSDNGADGKKGGNGGKREDQEIMAIKRFNSRRHRRRLLRTNSATDLIREQASQKSLDTSSHTSDKATVATAQTGTVVTAGSVSTHNGIPTPVPSPSPSPSPQPPIQSPPYKQKSSVLSDSTPAERSNASSQGSQLTLPHANLQRITSDGDCQTVASNNSESSIKWVAGFFGADAENSSLTHSGYYPSTQSEPAQYSGAVTPSSSASTGGIRFLSKPFYSRPNCPGCKALEVQISKAHEDIEYLRGVAIRNEYICKSCQTCDCPGDKSDDASTLSRVSQRLNDVSFSHKMQVEQLTKEQSKWQHDMNSNLSDLSNLCKHLDQKSTIKEKKCLTLQNELDDTRTERDELAGEVERLRAEAKSYEKMNDEYKKLKTLMLDYERKGLERASQAIETRDKLISDLSLRLELALDTLELERQQQRQRRQIMFPPRQGEVVAEDISAQVYEELRETKEELRINQSLLESSKADARKRELVLNARCENLEKQLYALKQ